MTPKQKIKVSKFISLVLRHKPDVIGLTLDENGWARTSDLLAGLKNKFSEMSLKVLKEIVAEDDKGRYAFNETGHKIRANQGHSLDVDVELTEEAPPDYLFHGTAKDTIWKIRLAGLLPMSRQHVHLSSDPDTATRVGKRHGEPTVLLVKSGEMSKAGFAFFRSANGVWLTERVPVDYLAFEDIADDEC